ncbi:alpha-hydroxy acid oxidase [Variovorax sp. J31P179]|jgi:(S)-mandelate dehydrogenase|uniref:alpha-hydroxy acid oxidase n=1 Tax=Variovorax sp. J31P179 TaxID=3053508 RepID=UPI0025771040|nr:alpha-hydroxy acid oxidase [Variovorax sp. J31P179]MDM0085006.1 alpha-hydroxy acid oxidase [Variovorax sp. J31P179]
MLLNTEDFRSRARRDLPRFVFDYIEGAADDGHCLRRNLSDLAAVELTPRVLRDTTTVETSIEVFGRKWALPFGIAPTGLNGLVRPGGDGLLATAASRTGISFALSTASNMRLEDVRAAAPESVQWMQLYVMHRDMASQIVERAARAKYDALVLTVDVPVSGNREADLRNGFRIPFKPTARVAWDVITHPRWSMRMLPGGAPDFANLTATGGNAGSANMQAALLARAMDRSLVWETLVWLRGLWKGPLLLKGILHPDDARLAVDHGVDGLIVSNHGGRQNDASPSAISALPRVVAAINGRIPVFMDGGIRRGGDIAKALALGATAAFVGRPVLYGLAADGARGAEAVIGLLAAELVRSMTLLGATSASALPDALESANGSLA